MVYRVHRDAAIGEANNRRHVHSLSAMVALYNSNGHARLLQIKPV